LQKKIVSRVVPSLRKGGVLLYITCSVFRSENEEVVDHIARDHSLKVEKKELLTGYNDKADTLFAALLRG
jgi:16S rRNA (cytosine967-C5)-methyltransferase